MKCELPNCPKRATCWFWLAAGRKGIHTCDTHAGPMHEQLHAASTMHHVLPLAKPETKENKDG